MVGGRDMFSLIHITITNRLGILGLLAGRFKAHE
jgi:hypothetical protein